MMKKNKNVISRFLQNFQNPKGFFGKIILWGMNKGHSSLSLWGMSHIEWKQNWNVLDIGCGGGANLVQMLQYCPQGEVYGIDISQVSVDFARKRNKDLLSIRCFIEQGTVNELPYTSNKFDVITAFETVYFWNDLHQAFTEVARVLKENGYFLICCEMNNPHEKTWSNRIEGMKIYSGEDLKLILSESGFVPIELYRKKNALCIVAQKRV